MWMRIRNGVERPVFRSNIREPNKAATGSILSPRSAGQLSQAAARIAHIGVMCRSDALLMRRKGKTDGSTVAALQACGVLGSRVAPRG